MRCKWEKVKLGDIVVFNPKLPLPKGSLAKKVGMEHLLPFSKYITKFELSSYAGGAKFMNGDILLARITPCLENGKTSQVTILDEDEIGFGSTEFIVLRGKDGISDKNFIYYLSISPQLRDYAIKSMVGSLDDREYNKAFWKTCILIVHPSQSKKRLQQSYMLLDAKIELNNRINKNLEAQAQAIFKSWFVDFEPFRDGEFVYSELGPIPKGWRVGALGEISKITMGQSPRGDSYNETGIGVVFFQGRGEFGDRFPTTRLFTSEPKRMAKANDILLSVRAPVGDYNIALEDCCIGRGLASIRPFAETYSYCVCMISNLRPVFDQYNGEGTVFGSINKNNLHQIRIVIPPNFILKSFEKVVEKHNYAILNNFKQNQALAIIRDTLLPKLMSGEMRVPLEV